MKNNLNAEQRLEKKIAWQKRLDTKGNIIKTDKDVEFCPRCIFKDQDLTLSSEGYFTPCCWIDDELYRSQPHVNDFFKPHLNIENNDDIQDIFNSKEWTDFWGILLDTPQDAPPVCYEYCANKQGDKEFLNYDAKNKIEVLRTH
jgi:hypothetical protein|tara:strand:+ start:639 stop:1070 length:432 start_codon:yes stop_codon:yes gene_type:complete